MFLKSLCLISSVVTCVLGGGDPIGSSGDDLGRCHIYYGTPDEYGACNYKTTSADVHNACGDTVSNPCLSTFNAGQSGDMSNCGGCYKVTKTYDDGVSICVYLVTEDTCGSEVKFEMGQRAWEVICPHACEGYGVCVRDASTCEYGELPNQFAAYDAPASCAVQNTNIHWERVDCNSGAGGCGAGGSPGPSPTAAPYPPAPTAAPYPPAPTAAPYPPAPTAAPYPPYPTAAPYPPAPTAAPYPPYPTAAPYPPAPTAAPYPGPDPYPTPNCWTPNGSFGAKCVYCPSAQGYKCPDFNWSTCYSGQQQCCQSCWELGQCTDIQSCLRP